MITEENDNTDQVDMQTRHVSSAVSLCDSLIRDGSCQKTSRKRRMRKKYRTLPESLTRNNSNKQKLLEVEKLFRKQKLFEIATD